MSRFPAVPAHVGSGPKRRADKTAKGSPYLKGVRGDAAAADAIPFPSRSRSHA